MTHNIQPAPPSNCARACIRQILSDSSVSPSLFLRPRHAVPQCRARSYRCIKWYACCTINHYSAGDWRRLSEIILQPRRLREDLRRRFPLERVGPRNTRALGPPQEQIILREAAVATRGAVEAECRLWRISLQAAWCSSSTATRFAQYNKIRRLAHRSPRTLLCLKEWLSSGKGAQQQFL